MLEPLSVGLGLRRELRDALATEKAAGIDFLELAPENVIRNPDYPDSLLNKLSQQYQLVAHGLSLSLGGVDPLNQGFLLDIRKFLDRFNIQFFSEHLSFCDGQGYLYELLPLPFTEEAVIHTAARIQEVQDILERRIAIENISYYCTLGGDLEEAEFISAVVETADCDLLLDVNNILVNSTNHAYDSFDFINSLPADRVSAYHIAGADNSSSINLENLTIDKHNHEINEPCWQTLDYCYQHIGVRPTLLERDFNIPPLQELLLECKNISSIQKDIE